MKFHRLFSAVIFLALSACGSLPKVQEPVAPVRPDQLNFPALSYAIPKIEPILLPGGVRLYLKEDHELPLVEVTAMVGGGSINDPEVKTGLGELFAATLRTGGAGSRDAESFDRELARMAAELSVGTDSHATNIGLSIRGEDLNRGLGLLADLLRRPRFDQKRLDLARRQIIEGIRRRNDEPESIAHRALMSAIYPNHPLGREAGIESVSAVIRDDLLAFHQRYFQPSNLSLGISGDFDRKELLALLNQLFGDWPSRDFKSLPVPALNPPAAPAVRVANKAVPQTTILFGQLGISKDNPDLHALKVMNYILGGGGFNSRLMREVRSNRGLAYSVYSYYQIGRILPGVFFAGSETKSSSTLEVVRLMREQMEKIRTAVVSEAELRVAKDSLINSFVFAFTDAHEVIEQQMRLDFYGYPPEYLQSYRDKVSIVTAADVQRVTQQYLDPARQTLVLVGDSGSFDGSVEALGMPVQNISVEQ